jgi:hypothetical protein
MHGCCTWRLRVMHFYYCCCWAPVPSHGMLPSACGHEPWSYLSACMRACTHLPIMYVQYAAVAPVGALCTHIASASLLTVWPGPACCTWAVLLHSIWAVQLVLQQLMACVVRPLQLQSLSNTARRCSAAHQSAQRSRGLSCWHNSHSLLI